MRDDPPRQRAAMRSCGIGVSPITARNSDRRRARRASPPPWMPSAKSSYMRDMASKRAFRIGRSRTGLGLFATAPIKKGAFIVEYKGRKLTNEQADKLEARGNRYLYA